MRGYFAIGVERASKAGNIGNLIRTAHAFGAAFAFAIACRLPGRERMDALHADTARTPKALPFYDWARIEDMRLPEGCRLVGIELHDEAVALPSFQHPLNAAYLLGGERFGLSEAALARCDHVVRIPTSFSLNLATAGAIVMYDRMIARGRFPARPLMPGGGEPLADPVHGGPRLRPPRRDDRN